MLPFMPLPVFFVDTIAAPRRKRPEQTNDSPGRAGVL